jgi:Protein of unknown function (DUF3309)
MGTLLIAMLAVLVLGAVPTWPYSRDWGYFPSSALGAALVFVTLLVLLGRM